MLVKGVPEVLVGWCQVWIKMEIYNTISRDQFQCYITRVIYNHVVLFKIHWYKFNKWCSGTKWSSYFYFRSRNWHVINVDIGSHIRQMKLVSTHDISQARFIVSINLNPISCHKQFGDERVSSLSSQYIWSLAPRFLPNPHGYQKFVR